MRFCPGLRAGQQLGADLTPDVRLTQLLLRDELDLALDAALLMVSSCPTGLTPPALFCPAAEPEHELFLVYGKGRPGVIRGMDMNAKVPDEYMIPIENLMNPRALDFHAESEFIYFADATSYIIGRQKIDGSERDTIVKEGAVSPHTPESGSTHHSFFFRDAI